MLFLASKCTASHILQILEVCEATLCLTRGDLEGKGRWNGTVTEYTTAFLRLKIKEQMYPSHKLSHPLQKRKKKEECNSLTIAHSGMLLRSKAAGQRLFRLVFITGCAMLLHSDYFSRVQQAAKQVWRAGAKLHHF